MYSIQSIDHAAPGASSQDFAHPVKQKTCRIIKQLKDIQKSPQPIGFIIKMIDNDINHLEAKIIGPNGSPYQGGSFVLDIFLAQNYPFKPPVIKFKTKIYHPNVYLDGSLCLDILYDQWTPTYTIQKLLLSIISLLSDEWDIQKAKQPQKIQNSNNQQNQSCQTQVSSTQNKKSPQSSIMYLENKQLFIQTAKQWTKLYSIQ